MEKGDWKREKASIPMQILRGQVGKMSKVNCD